MKKNKYIVVFIMSLIFSCVITMTLPGQPEGGESLEDFIRRSFSFNLTTEAGLLDAINDEDFLAIVLGTASETRHVDRILSGSVKIGDVNNDTKVNIKDAVMLILYCEGKPGPSCILDVADVNRDGEIDRTDPLLICQYCYRMIPAFPVVDVTILLSQMTLREKIGQMIQVEQTALFDDEVRTETHDPQITWIPETGICPDDVTTYAIGSFLSGGDSFPYTGGNVEGCTLTDWADMYDCLQEKALANRLMIPLLYSADTVHGFGNLQGATIFPHNIGLGATRDTQLLKRIGEITAVESSAAGVNWAFSPCVAVPQDDRWGRTYEGYSENPLVVSQMAVAYINGLQGANQGDGRGMSATLKHFVGDGGTSWGSGLMAKTNSDGQPIGGYLLDRGDTPCCEAELRAVHLAPYVAAITQADKQPGAVMVSYSSWNMEKCHASRYLITDVLKHELGFNGVVISDWDGFAQINAASYSDPGTLDTAINDLLPSELKTCINAGVDILMVESIWSHPWRFKEVMQMIEELVLDGDISPARIDDAVHRIITLKKDLNLFEKPFASREYQDLVGSPGHRTVAREAVQKSLVLLKNKRNILPIRKGIGHIHVAGPKADDMKSQCGGWTLSWQGSGHLLSGGTTILEGIRKSVEGTGSLVTYSEDGVVPCGANVVFVVFGENAYAEYKGDRGDDCDPFCLCAEDNAVIDRVVNSHVPVIGILLSGSPVMISDQLEKFDALIAAWIPGSEGQGIADVLFGDYNPTGKLPYTWPRSVDQIPINDPFGTQNPLFPYGFGLSYP